jgi:hypothetical protein
MSGEYSRRHIPLRSVVRLTIARKIHPALAPATTLMGFTAVASPRSPCVLVNAQPSRSLAAVRTRRVALGSAAHRRGWTCNGILPVDFHPTSETELGVGPLPPSLGSMVRTLSCPKLIAEKMRPRPRTPGNTFGLRRALSSMQAITSATNRSLAERPEEGRLQQMHPMVTKKRSTD